MVAGFGESPAVIAALMALGCVAAFAIVRARPVFGVQAWVALLPFQFAFSRERFNVNFAPSDLLAVGLVGGLCLDLLRRRPVGGGRAPVAGFSFVVPLSVSLAIGLAAGTYASYAVVNKWLGFLLLSLTALSISRIIRGDFDLVVRIVRTFIGATLVATIVSVAAYWLGVDQLWVWSAVQSDRLAGTLLESPPFGALLTVAWLIQTALLISGIRVFSPTLDWLSCCLLFHAICLTFARSAYVGVAAGAFVLAVAGLRAGRGTVGRRLVSLPAIMLVVALTTFGAAFMRESTEISQQMQRMAIHRTGVGVFGKFLEDMFLRQWTTSVRYVQISEGLRLWLNRPLAGIGLGRFLVESPRWFGQPYQIHNTYVWILVEMGLLGLLWFGAFIWIVAEEYLAAARIESERRWWAIGLGAAFISILGFMVGTEGLYQRPLWLLVALAAAVGTPARRREREPSSRADAGGRPAEPEPKLRVMQVVTRLNIGGITQQVILLAAELRRRGYPAEVAAGQPAPAEGNKAQDARAAGVTVHDVAHLDNSVNPFRSLRSFLELYLLFRRARPDVVHLYMLKARLVGALAARAAGVPVVVETLHGNLLRGYYNRVLTGLLLMGERAIGWLLVDRVITVSALQRDELLQARLAPARRLVMQLPGSDVEGFRDVAERRGRLRSRLGLPESVVLVGLVGRLVPIKGIDVFLAAAATVRERAGDALFFVVAGDGPLRQQLEDENRRLGLADRCIFLGALNDLRDFYADCDIVALSSRNEGAPIALLEAMAAARAIVATRVGGVADMIENEASGLIVPPEAPEALAAAMARLAADRQLRQRLGARARERTDHFSIEQFVRGSLTTYREVWTGKQPVVGHSD
jgi:glycosyltransferase involved in cell wall biosynthesis